MSRQIDDSFQASGSGFGYIDEWFDSMHKRLDALEKRVDLLDERLSILDDRRSLLDVQNGHRVCRIERG